MANTDFLRSNTPVEVLTGRYRGQKGHTAGSPDALGYYTVILQAKPGCRAAEPSFGRNQLQVLNVANLANKIAR